MLFTIATPHSAMGRFTYPGTTQAGFLIKLRNSQNGEYAPSTAKILGGTCAKRAKTPTCSNCCSAMAALSKPVAFRNNSTG